MGSFQKAKMQRLDGQFNVVAEISVLFNPTEFTLNKAVQLAEVAIPGLDMPILQFVRGQTETLTVDLFFDSTEDGTAAGATPVTEFTDAFYQLIKIDPIRHAPPVCRFAWGDMGFAGSAFTDQWATQNRVNGFQCVVESVRQRFTLFSPEGRPLRAVLSLSLREYRTLEQQIDEIRHRSPDHTSTIVVKQGDTLARIAHKAYGDATAWRAIAERNRLEDPLELVPGAVLDVPPIR